MTPTHPSSAPVAITRRHLFSQCAMGLGGLALSSLLGNSSRAAGADAAPATENPSDPMRPRQPHYAPKARNIIYLFMAGGPSQLELFDHKPRLQQLSGQPIPDSFLEGKRFAFMDSSFKNRSTLLGSRRTFRQHGQSGAWTSDWLPHLSQVVDDLAIVRSCATNIFNHAPAKLFMNCGSAQFGRPSLGSWVTYGLGSESRDLPGFVVLQSGPRGPRGGPANWTSGFLPTTFQGVPFRGIGDPILNLSQPADISTPTQARTLQTLRSLNLQRAVETGDPEILTRIASYEMAFRMQASAPDLIDLSQESDATLQKYGCDRAKPSFARNCLLARRLVERGVRFVQLYHADWDSHGGPGQTIDDDMHQVVRDIDQPCAALIQDLKSRGLLQDTLVIWGGEFGRTPMGEIREKTGRNHHIDAFTMWFAGAGVRPGITLGATDELGFNAVEDRAHVHDIHATLLHLLGLQHDRLTFRFQGRDFRLTDVHGELLPKLIA